MLKIRILSIISMSLMTLMSYAQSFEKKIVYFNPDGNVQKSIAAVDFNNDGLKDLLMASSDPNVFWLKNLGNNVFGPKIELFDEEIFGWAAKPIDINNDGNMDIAAACAFANIIVTIMGNGDGTFQDAVVIESDLEPISDLKVFDINQDGYDDIAYSTFDISDDIGKVYWSINNGEGEFLGRKIIAPNSWGTENIEFADLDNDQLPDLISKSKWDDKFLWFKNLGDNNFSTENVVRPPISTSGSRPLSTADMDNDGDIDLISYENEDIVIYENNGTGDFTPRSVTASSFSWGLVAADFNYDGNIDIFSGSGTDKKAVILYANDDYTFQEEEVLTADIGQIIDIWLEDMNDDGSVDILTTSSLYNGYLLFTNGNEFISSSTSINSNINVIVYPNPTIDKLIIESDMSAMHSIDLFNISGDLVLNKQLNLAKNSELSLQKLPRGYYALIIKDGNNQVVYSQRIVMQ